MKRVNKLTDLIATVFCWISKARLQHLILLTIVPLGQVHQLFHEYTEPIDVFLLIDYKLSVQWTVKFIGETLQFIMVCYLLAYPIPRTALIRKIYMALLLYGLLDMVLFFVNLKKGMYVSIYFLSACVWVYCSNTHSDNKTSLK